MKRDMELIRGLLFEFEGETKPDLSKWTEEQKLYHAALLIEAGLLRGEVIHDSQGKIATAIIYRLTWEGHEFLDAARDETVWKKVRDKLETVGTNVALPLLVSLLTDFTKQKLGIK